MTEDTRNTLGCMLVLVVLVGGVFFVRAKISKSQQEAEAARQRQAAEARQRAMEREGEGTLSCTTCGEPFPASCGHMAATPPEHGPR